MSIGTLEILATCLFALAVVHTFMSSRFQAWASRYPEGSIRENLFHLLGEVEVVFGLWAGVLISALAVLEGGYEAIRYAESLNFTEPLFVFAIMTVAATRPIIGFARFGVLTLARWVPLPSGLAAYLGCLSLGPLLGSFITEPAAMTVMALVLRDLFFSDRRLLSSRAKYLTLAILFVNVSIGGVLTHFAAPPVLMVSAKWQWDTIFMFTHFGWKAMIAVVVNALGATWFLRRELCEANLKKYVAEPLPVPLWLTLLHFIFLALIVMTAHHAVIFIGLVLFFLGVTVITREYQESLKLREALLVAFFLGGLVVLGGPQRWWLEPLLRSLNDTMLFLGATGLTAITDNAALTYLGSQVPDLADNAKFALVAGAVTGGGLTVIANAPNPIGFSVLQGCFGENGISPSKLLGAAVIPTLVAALALWFL